MIVSIGIREPKDKGELFTQVINGDTGMFYEVFTCDHPEWFIFSADHEDVGQVAWYETNSLEEFYELALPTG